VPYHWGRFQDLATREQYPPIDTNVMESFDTRVYHPPGTDLLTSLISADKILLGSEMLGAARGDNPDPGFPWNDTQALRGRGQAVRRQPGEDPRNATSAGSTPGLTSGSPPAPGNRGHDHRSSERVRLTPRLSYRIR
jgi:hypothetical protein